NTLRRRIRERDNRYIVRAVRVTHIDWQAPKPDALAVLTDGVHKVLVLQGLKESPPCFGQLKPRGRTRRKLFLQRDASSAYTVHMFEVDCHHRSFTKAANFAS